MKNRRFARLAGAALAAVFALSACGGGGEGGNAANVQDGSDMDALVAAAKAEGELVAYWHSSRIEKAGEAFTAKYGIKVTGTKQTDSETTERIVREVESGNVLADVIGYDDGARLANDLIPNHIVSNYVPPAYKDKIPAEFQDPMIYLFQVTIWGYNTEAYPDGCPVKNIWELTQPEWKSNIHMLDPRLRTTQVQWFAELEKHSDELAAAYKELTGSDLQLTESNAGLEFIKRLGENDPILHQGDEEVAAAVGVKGQAKPPLGQYTLGRHRDNEKLDHALAFCDLTPFPAFNQPTYVGVVEKAKHPNAARLFINFLMTDEGVSPWTSDLGAYSVVPGLPANPDNPYPSIEAWGDRILNLTDTKNVATRRGELLDFWTKING
ncbi:MAG: ABC transporter substrate-binding protein [Arachnia sp.]